MKPKLAKTILASVLAFALAGCYEDKGNYDYHDVNGVTIELAEQQVRMPKVDDVEVTLTPTIVQTKETGEENLDFQWLIAKEGAKALSDKMTDYTPYTKGKACKVTVKKGHADNIGLLLVVTDKLNGTQWFKTTQVKIVKPFNPCWFVLYEQGGKAQLGAVEGTSEGHFVFADVYQSERNEPFPLSGKPLAVAARKVYGNKEAASLFGFWGFTANPGMVIATTEGVAFVTPSTLAVKYSTDKILFEPTAKGTPIKIENYKMDTHGELFVNNGKAYFAHMDGACVPYSLKEGDKYPAISAYGAGNNALYFYDSYAHRFLKRGSLGLQDFYGTPKSSVSLRKGYGSWTDRGVELKPVGQRNTYVNVFDPDNVPAELTIADIVVGGAFGNQLYAVGYNNAGKQLTVFKFSCRSTEPFCAAKYTVDMPGEVNVKTAKFTASYAYSADLLFMAAANKVYRIDLKRNKVVEIYAAPADAQVVCAKFKDRETTETLGTTLGVAYNQGDKGTVVELKLTAAGDLARTSNASFVYGNGSLPFGKIVDITFNYE